MFKLIVSKFHPDVLIATDLPTDKKERQNEVQKLRSASGKEEYPRVRTREGNTHVFVVTSSEGDEAVSAEYPIEREREGKVNLAAMIEAAQSAEAKKQTRRKK